MSPVFSGQIIANLVIMSRTSAAERQKAALLVEGDKDSRVFRKFIDPTQCRVVSASNRKNAEEALSILKAAGERGVLAIVDADTDHLEGKTPSDPDLIITHTRDLEGLLLRGSSIVSVLTEFDLELDVFGADPEIAALKAVVPLGYVRFIISRKAWQVRLSGVDFAAFIDVKTLKCDLNALCRHVSSLTITAGIGCAEYQKELAQLVSLEHDPLIVARGHDITAMLAWAISARAGKKKKYGAKITADLVESYLRTAYQASEFSGNPTHKKIQEWEANNRPYRVLSS